MGTTYLILAGGHSTRVPGKIFLSQLHGPPVFFSALECVHRADPHARPVVLTSPELRRTVETMLSTRYGSSYGYRVENDHHSGMTGVLVEWLGQSQKTVVLCGDNLYGRQTAEAIVVDRDQSWAAVQQLPQPRGVELDGYDREQGRWGSRGGAGSLDLFLTTPWVFTGCRWPDGELDVVAGFNRLDVTPVEVRDPAWRDLGTAAEVRRYYEGG